MTEHQLENVNITGVRVLISPEALHHQVPTSESAAHTIELGRRAIQGILDHEDPRFLVIVGPCSIHDLTAAREYAERLKRLHDELGDVLLIVMRVYFEKPRTTVGWKCFINDPHINDSFDIEEGVRRAREPLVWPGELGLPHARQAL